MPHCSLPKQPTCIIGFDDVQSTATSYKRSVYVVMRHLGQGHDRFQWGNVSRRRWLIQCFHPVLAIILVGLLTLLIPFSVVGADAVVNSPDRNLDAAIRKAISRAAGDTYQSDLGGLAALTAPEQGIIDLTGLESCTSLGDLGLQFNQISDI